jgi:hypothetical protein
MRAVSLGPRIPRTSTRHLTAPIAAIFWASTALLAHWHPQVISSSHDESWWVLIHLVLSGPVFALSQLASTYSVTTHKKGYQDATNCTSGRPHGRLKRIRQHLPDREPPIRGARPNDRRMLLRTRIRSSVRVLTWMHMSRHPVSFFYR